MKNEKKLFDSAEIEIVKFDNCDIVTVSGGPEPDEDITTPEEEVFNFDL